MAIKYKYKENIFEIIDSKEKAYWIGFLYADGYILSGSASFGVALKEEDKNHLINFLKFICIENPIEETLKYNSKTHSYRIIIGRKSTYNDLINIGFSTNKSHENSLKIWDSIPDKYKKDFLLGLWDGDGNFSISSNNKNLASIISNNDMLLYKISEFINFKLGKNFAHVKPRTNGDPYPRIRFTRNKAKYFGDWLYDDKIDCYLVRKYKQYLQMQVGTKIHRGIDHPLVKCILCIESNNIYITAKDCCIGEFGIDNLGAQNNVRSCCRGERISTRNKHFRYLSPEERKEWINGEFNLQMA